MNYLLLIPACYLLLQANILKTHNLLSTIFFKVVPTVLSFGLTLMAFGVIK